jgi:RecB family endonuclease NucS
MISKLIPVELREVWKNEAKDFTTWLGNNLDYIKEQLGIELSLVETEKSVGAFYVDVLAKDNNDRLVIIENQLGKTDHDHLGKVLTYLTNLEAKTAI